ncbi:MAG: retropepsin-like aspartic protease [Ideonella sp.]|nr:retropepsin-like aspartic protease [Ideonella sp.]
MNEPPKTLKLLTIWLLLGTVIFLAFQWWLHERAKPRIQWSQGQVTLQRAADGHYHWPATLSGPKGQREVVFLIDTGATSSVLPGEVAQALGLPQGPRFVARTASGEAEGWRSTVDLALEGGFTQDRMAISVLPSLTDAPLLGMDVLGRLRLEQGQGVMTLSLPEGQRD